MKFLRKSWKLGMSLFLCASLLSMTAVASGPIPGTDTAEETEELTDPAVEIIKEELTENADAKETEPEDIEAAKPEEEVSEAENETEDTLVMNNTRSDPDEADVLMQKTEMRETTGKVVKSGECGLVMGTVFYTVTDMGSGQYDLNIYGSGEMLTIGVPYGAPWHKYSGDIVSIEMEEGLESVTQYAFTDCDRVSSVTIPASVRKLQKKSFQMRGLKSVLFLGSWSDDFNADAFSKTEDVEIRYDLNDPSWEGKSFSNVSMQYTRVEALEPSCTTDGNLPYYYNKSEDKYYADQDGKPELIDKDLLVIPAFGHNWDDGTVTKEPSVTEEGIMTYTCLRCDETRVEPIALLPNEDGTDEDAADEDAADEDAADEDEMGNISTNMDLTFQERLQGSPKVQTQDAPVSAGMVKTADENNQILYLVLLIACGIVIFCVIRKRISRS